MSQPPPKDHKIKRPFHYTPANQTDVSKYTKGRPMNVDDVMARAYTAHSLELAASDALRSLDEQCRPEVARMIWLLGYCKGRSDACVEQLAAQGKQS